MDLDSASKSGVIEANVEQDGALAGLPDLRTVISRPSSISDAESDDYQIKPKVKK